MNNLDNLLMLNYTHVYGYIALIFKADMIQAKR